MNSVMWISRGQWGNSLLVQKGSILYDDRDSVHNCYFTDCGYLMGMPFAIHRGRT